MTNVKEKSPDSLLQQNSRHCINEKNQLASMDVVKPDEALVWQHYFEIERIHQALQIERQRLLDSRSMRVTAPLRKLQMLILRLRNEAKMRIKRRLQPYFKG